jgi:hypothetical protein
MALSFTNNGTREYREGLVVRFYPKNSEPWVGNFLGGMTTCSVVLAHPNGTDIIVVVQGEVHIVDPDQRVLRRTFSRGIEEVIPILALNTIVFRSIIDFESIAADNTGWRSARISWDGFRNINVSGTELWGEAYTPVQDAWVPFRLDLITGHCPNGIFENEMAGAVLISKTAPDHS